MAALDPSLLASRIIIRPFSPWLGFAQERTVPRITSLAEEVAYPTALAVAIARCFHAAVDVTPPVEPDIAAVRAVAGAQPKASKLPPLDPSFWRSPTSARACRCPVAAVHAFAG